MVGWLGVAGDRTQRGELGGELIEDVVDLVLFGSGGSFNGKAFGCCYCTNPVVTGLVDVVAEPDVFDPVANPHLDFVDVGIDFDSGGNVFGSVEVQTHLVWLGWLG